jgi:hypothetical protein
MILPKAHAKPTEAKEDTDLASADLDEDRVLSDNDADEVAKGTYQFINSRYAAVTRICRYAAAMRICSGDADLQR